MMPKSEKQMVFCGLRPAEYTSSMCERRINAWKTDAGDRMQCRRNIQFDKQKVIILADVQLLCELPAVSSKSHLDGRKNKCCTFC